MRAVLVIVMATALAWPAAADTVPSYKVIAEQKSDSYRAVDIRIEQRLDETDLAAIANAIVGREQRPHARTIVNFLLPTARPGDQPWASATLLREVRVKIPGLRLDEERLFTAEAHADRRDVIGAWLTSTPATPGRLTIFREGKRLYAEWRLRSGVTTKDELSETRVAAGRRYDIRSSASEDHFMVTGGELEIRARGGRIAIAERIGPAPVEQPLVSALRQRNATVEKWPPAPSAGEAAAASATAGRLQTTGASAATDAEGTIATNAAARSAARRTVRKVIAPPSPPRIDLWVYLQPTS